MTKYDIIQTITYCDILYVFFDVANVNSRKLIENKIIIFLTVASISTIYSILNYVRRTYKPYIWRSLGNGIIIGLFAFIGYTLLIDSISIGDNKYLTPNNISGIPGGMNTILFITIMISIIVGKIFLFLFNY